MKESTIRALGVVAIIGGLVNMVADFFIISQPIPPGLSGLEVLSIMPLGDVRIGVALGLFALTT